MVLLEEEKEFSLLLNTHTHTHTQLKGETCCCLDGIMQMNQLNTFIQIYIEIIKAILKKWSGPFVPTK